LSCTKSSDLSYRRQITKELKRIFISKLEVLFPKHKVALCTFIGKKSNEPYSKVDLHQDRSFADEANLKTFGVWCPLVDVNEQNGCFQVVQKSHWLNSVPRSSNGFPYSQEILSLMKQRYLTSVPMRAGQALVYDNRLFHGSFPNLTSAERVAAICVLTPKDSPVLLYYRDPQVPNKLEVFKVDDAFYDSYIQESKPENAASLGTFDYQVDPITPEQLVKFMDASEIEVSRDTKIKKRFLSFFNLLRGNDWWFYKIPPLLAIAYAEIILLDLPFTQAIVTVLALVFISIFAAGYGYVINDIFDGDVDQQVGKHNSMAQFSPWQRTLLCFALAGLGFSLPVLMQLGTLAIVLLGIDYLLPTLYSAPPFRLKEKGILGVISDAAGAHAIPTLFIATTFSHLVAIPSIQATALAITATVWAFFAGVRGILLHQLWDYNDDLKSGVKTLVTESPVENVRFWMTRVIFPTELLLLAALILVISYSAPFVLVSTLFYFLIKLSFAKSDPTSSFDPAPIEKSYVVPHDFYEVGLPLILATTLSLQNEWFIIFLLLQVILFYPSIEQRVTNLVQSLRDKPQDLHPLQTQLNAAQANVTQLNTQLQSTQSQLQHLQTNVQCDRTQTETEFAVVQKDLEHAQEQLSHVQTQLEHVTQALTLAQSAHLNSQAQAQAQATRFQDYLQHTQGKLAVIDYYRYQIATEPDNLQLYYQALDVQPDDVQFLLQLGNALVRRGQLTEAIATYRVALQFHPNNFDLHIQLAKTFEKNKQWEESISIYRQAIELNPNDALAHKYLGDRLAEQGQLDEASFYYGRSLQLQTKVV